MRHFVALSLLLATACGGGSPAPASSSGGEAEPPAPVPVAPIDPARPAIDPAQMREVLRAQSPAVDACYQQALARDPSRRGRVVVAFVVGTDGHVSRAAVDESTLGDADAERCIAEVVSGLVFPRPTRGIVEARYPFELRPVDRDRDGID